MSDDKLATAARRLATEIAPQRDLWPGIEEAISKPRRTRWSPVFAQAAAVVLLVGASSLVTYVAVKYDAANEPQQVVVRDAPTNLVFEQAAFGADHTLNSVFGRAGGDVSKQLELDLASLSPEAREDVERNLAVIRQAIADISAALEKEPNNEFLQALLVEAYGNQLAVIRRIGKMTQRVNVRNDI